MRIDDPQLPQGDDALSAQEKRSFASRETNLSPNPNTTDTPTKTTSNPEFVYIVVHAKTRDVLQVNFENFGFALPAICYSRKDALRLKGMHAFPRQYEIVKRNARTSWL